MASKTLLFALFATLLIAGCAPQGQTAAHNAIANAPQTQTELVRADVLGNGLVSTNITVLGVRVGMAESAVQRILGVADNAQEYDFGSIQNWEYSTSLGITDTGVLIHLEHGFVTRITVFPQLNAYLHGDSVINKTKAEIYDAFGRPSRTYDIKGGRYFIYNDRGLEIFLGRDNEAAFGLTLPNRKLPTTVVLPGNRTQSEVPHLISDTTTLCTEGPTFAFDTLTKKCTPYPNACAIPENEVEVKSCSAADTSDAAISAAVEAVQ